MSIAVVRRTGSLRRNHGCSERMFRRTFLSESRTFAGLFVPSENLSGNANFRFFDFMAADLELFSCIVARLARCCCRSGGDRGYDGCTRLRFSASGLPQLGAQDCIDVFKGAIFSPLTEVVVDALPRRQVVRQHSPSATTTQDIKDGIQNFAHIVFARSAPVVGREKRLENLPLSIGQVTRICFSALAHSMSILAESQEFLNTL